jgi:PAS domain S-box-containing protein
VSDPAAKREAIPLRTLILEDRIADVDLLLYELRRAGFEPLHRHVDNAKDYGECLSADFDVILADYNLPQFNALEALRILQEQGLFIPFIVVTGSISEEAAVTCMKSGATDYLLKDRLARLGPAIRQALEARSMREAKLKAEEQMRRRNRELFLLNRIIAASTRTLDERAFLQVACTETANALGAFLAAAFMLDEESGQPAIVAEHSSVPGLSLRETAFPETWGSMIAMLRGLHGPAVLNDLTDSHPMFAPHAGFLERRFASMAIVPLVVDGVTAGGLGLFSDTAGHFSEERGALLKSVADELSNVLARTRLERDRLRLGAAVEQSADAVLILGPDGVIRYVNTGFERMSGRMRSEAIGRPSLSLIDDRPEPRVVREVTECIRTGRDWHGRMSAHRRDGGPLTADIAFSPIRDRTGRLVNFVMIARDVTEALRLEQRYIQAQKMEAIGRLAGGIAHDFNNLLTSIMGYAELLAGRFPQGTPEEGEVRQIQTAVERAAALTRQLLLFGRAQVLAPRLLALNDVVTETAPLLKPLLGDAVELHLALDSSLRPVMADPGQLGQVIMNLALNARDAMASGGRIDVSTANVRPDGAQARELAENRHGPWVALRVSDTGMGIRPEVLSHVFEPFFTTKSEGKGTGLGLAIVFGIVKQSGGHIRIESEVGKGTTFEILLPATG